MASVTVLEVTKEILISMIDKELIIKKPAGEYKDIEESNKFNTNEVCKAYELIFKTVSGNN